MTPSELTTRVTLDTCVAVGALAGLGWWLLGAPIGAGVLAGGVLAVVARAFVATEMASRSSAAWILGAGLRFAACAAACGILLAYGWAHPVALVAGFTVLPCDLIARGLESARTER